MFKFLFCFYLSLLALGMCSCNNRQAGSGKTVYITFTGNTYHSSQCRYLGKNSIPLLLNDAIERKYHACSDCIRAL